MQESWKMTFICKKNTRFLIFARTLQDTSYLQEKWKISNICKNVARYLLFAWTLRYIFNLKESCKVSLIRKYIGRYLFSARISQIVQYLQGSWNVLFFAETWQVTSFLQESRKLSDICMIFAKYVLFAET